MAWKYWNDTIQKCSKCGEETRVHPSFGKWICEDCKSKRPKIGTGNSGLRNTGITAVIPTSSDLQLLHVPKSDGLFGKLFFEHYPGSKGIPGRSICYLVYNDYKVVGIIGVNSPPRNYKIFRAFFSATDDLGFVNNNVFRLINNEKNLGTQVLRIFRKQIKIDYEQKYGNKLFGIVTFVEPPRTGAVYKADNWQYLGLTQGKRLRRNSETWAKEISEGTKKLIFVYKYK